MPRPRTRPVEGDPMMVQCRATPPVVKPLAVIALVGTVLCLAGAAHAAGDGEPVNLWPFIKPTGLTTLSLMVIAAGLAAMRKIRPRLMLKLHKILAPLGVVSGLCHATLAFLAG